ncbi:hypothetical protein [Legionella oakridgensis]|uniref:Uncharacterized protein n=2 Tax=Legionella oakridgensis TaxID=29423 RepID=W0BGS6_9GAMM|nr:hypothetical protein [Legionella oakridgensis]AHE67802.1 hypothetical protein Loa_02260 [Legionella oakridgensis ATCC 33761 = DSM 21215]KTD44048.1 hypothetical protein Loak_0190 [Legionella oakridgensis]STY20816.1 Uncharacterised protein [Legionella longbeachae]
MANKNQKLLEAIQRLESEAAKAALDALIQASDDTKFRKAVRAHSEALGLGEDFIAAANVGKDEDLKAAGNDDDSADPEENKIEALRQAAAGKRVMLELEALNTQELQKLSEARDEAELRRLLTASQAFASLRSRADWANLLTEEALERIKEEAGNLAVIKDVQERVAAAEHAIDEGKPRIQAAVANFGAADPGNHVEESLKHLKGMQEEITKLKEKVVANQDLLTDRELKDGLDARLVSMQEALTADIDAVKAKKAELLAFVAAKHAIIQQKAIDAALPANAGAFDNLSPIYADAKKALDAVLQAEELARFVEVDGPEAFDDPVRNAGTEFDKVAKAYATPLAEKIKGLSQAAASVDIRGKATAIDAIDVSTLRLTEAQQALFDIRQKLTGIEQKLKEAEFIERRAATVFQGDAAAQTAFNTKLAAARAEHRQVADKFAELQRKVTAEFGPTVVVSGEKAPTPPKKTLGEAVRLMERDGLMPQFTDTVVLQGRDFYKDIPPGPRGAGVSIAAAAAHPLPSFAGVTLKEGDCIRSTAVFATGQDPRHSQTGGKGYAIIRQDHQAKVTDESINLTAEQKQIVALKMAKMLLANYKPSDGAIIIRCNNASAADTEMANKVYAALLLLKDSNPKLSGITIDSRVPGCTGPGKWTRNSTFIKEHLGDAATSHLTKGDREDAKTQLGALTEAKYATQRATKGWFKSLRTEEVERKIQEGTEFTAKKEGGFGFKP